MKKILFFSFLVIGVLGYSQKKKSSKGKSSASYSIEQALSYVEDYFDFYDANTEWDNPVIRKVSENTFFVKVSVCSGGREICYDEDGEKKDFFWRSQVYTLKINGSGNYTMNIKPY